MSSNNNSTKNPSKNDYVEFQPYWKKEQECFDNATYRTDVETFDEKTGRYKTERNKQISWPRPKPTEQIGYENFMAKITNPATKKFYSERDKNGNQIEQKDGKNARYVVTNIIRFNKNDGSEWLFTQGQIQGFNSLGSPVSHSISNPERRQKTEFSHERKFNEKTQTVVEYCKGPSSTYDVYETPFSKENVDRLYKHGVGVDGNKLLEDSDNSRAVTFYCEEENRDLTIRIFWSSTEKTLELFKTKDWEYLANGDFVPDDVKREMRAKSFGLTGGNPADIPRFDKDNENYKGFTL